MSAAYKNIAVVGASGSLGSVVYEKLVSSGKFDLKVLRRHGSKSVFPEGTKVVDVDFKSVEELTAALKGQDAVVITAGTELLGGQDVIIEAAIAAGVKRVLPSEFGSDLDVEAIRKLPVFADKVKIHDLAIEKSKTTPLTYTFVYNAGFLDWGIQHKFTIDVSEGKPTIYDGGDHEFSVTSLGTVGEAVVAILSNPDATKNRAVYIQDLIVTQNRLVELAKEVAPEKTITPVHVSVDEQVQESNKKLAAGDYGYSTWIPYLAAAVFNREGYAKYTKNDNELLGLKGKTEEDVKELLKTYQLS